MLVSDVLATKILRRCALAASLLAPAGIATAQSALDDSLSPDSHRERSALKPAHLPTTLRLAAPPDTPVVRPRAIVYGNAYYTRLTIHRYGSYAMLPLLAAEYSLGQNLIHDASPPSWMKSAHGVVAGGIGVLFGVNTITGVWNLWESRDDPAGRTRRIVHSVMMIASDAGFVATAALAPDHHRGGTISDSERTHRSVAIGSIALSTVGGVMMWFWKE